MDWLRIIQAALMNDKGAYSRLGFHIRRRLQAYGIPNIDDLHELCNDILLKVARVFSGEPPCLPEKTGGFLEQMIANTAKDFHKYWSRPKHSGGKNLTDDADASPSRRFDPETQALAREFIRRMPKCERAAVEGAMRGESIPETAQRVGISVGALKRCRARAFKILEDLFGRDDEE